jgi:hypothetical protein
VRLFVKVAYALILFAVGLSTGVHAATLGEALDNTNLVWTTCTSNAVERPWLVEVNGNPHDGVDDAVSGNQFKHNTVSWLQTTLVGPGTLSYWCRVSSEEPFMVMDEVLEYFDYLTVDIEGVEVDRIAGPCGNWVYRSFVIPAGTNIVRWTFVKDGSTQDSCGIDQARLDQARFDPAPQLPLAQALGTCGWEWTSGSTSDMTTWGGQTNVSVDGIAAQSGFANTDEESWMSVTVWGVSNVSFLWRVSSLTNADYLEFYTNSYVHDPFSPPANYAARISGEVSTWRSNFFKVSATATNTLTWRYVKSAATPVGENRGWVDQVKFGPDPGRTPFTLTSPNLLANGQFQFSLIGKSNCTCRVEASTNFLQWTPLQDIYLTTNSITSLDPTSVQHPDQRYYRANTQ